uniref:CCHC-type domain-containing protein n=1 Tax=Tanacetum cinerariifolium TaxID=118510 RepID=A0A6L2P1D6_TANCI|nr:hypothetical protein [Tanacetum cinerariifolium]
MPPRRNNRRNETPKVDLAFAAAMQQAVRALLHELTAEITAGMNNENNANNPNNVNRINKRSGGNGNGGNDGDAQATIHVWLERFQKQNPLTFSLAPTPVEAENLIAHIEKIFEVLGYDDQFKARLVAYKLEGDAHSWWRAYKQAKDGDAYVETLSWDVFRDIFFLEYFPRSEQENYKREYKSIRQLDGERSIEFMTRFVRLAGFLGAKAGTLEEQVKNFKWALNDIARDKLVNMEFTDVTEVVNAARNIEILQKKMLASTQNDKRFNASYSNSVPITMCTICGKRHPSNTCYKAIGACFTCGAFGHRAKDCKNKDRKGNGGDDKDDTPKNIGGRVFAMTSSQFKKA